MSVLFIVLHVLGAGAADAEDELRRFFVREVLEPMDLALGTKTKSPGSTSTTFSL